MTIAEAFARLDQFPALERNWDTYDADPITSQAIGVAREVLGILEMEGLEAPFVAPQADGGVILEWWVGKSSAAIWIEADGSLIVTVPPDHHEVSVSTPAGALQVVREGK